MLYNWIIAARVKTLPVAMCPVIIGCVMAYKVASLDLVTACMTGLCALLIQIGTNLANDYFDYKKGADTQARLGPTRVVSAGLLSEKDVKRGMVIVFLVAFLFGLVLAVRGGWPIFWIGVISILCGVLYTGGPVSLAYLGIADVFALLFFGPVSVAGTYYLQTFTITAAVVIAGLAPGMMAMSLLAVNNIRDVKEDTVSKKKTIAVRFGVKVARFEYVFSMVFASLVPLWLWLHMELNSGTLWAIGSLIVAQPLIRTVLTQEGRILNRVLGQTSGVLIVYTLAFCLGYLGYLG